jgi:hypothetical protein
VVVDGVLHAEGATLQAGDAVPDDVELRSDAPARVRVASVDVEIAPHTRLRKRDRAVLLDAGKLEIEAAGEVVRVVTERFELELTDGRVVIEPAGVHVDRGSARVLDSRGKELARLDTGGRWPPAKQPPRAKPQPSTSELMARARAHFAAGERDDAERVATSALARPLARADEVEARMFLADLAQASGNLALAARRYEEVATKFADLPAAESALYAAARVEARRGRDDAARVLFDRYLARYPQGRYADDVRRQRRIR